jgi:hypothetical protein
MISHILGLEMGQSYGIKQQFPKGFTLYPMIPSKIQRPHWAVLTTGNSSMAMAI